MNQRIGSAILVVVGVVLGLAFDSYRRVDTYPPAAMAADADEPPDQEVVKQLKEINGHLKDIDAYLRSGELRVINIINPDTAQVR